MTEVSSDSDNSDIDGDRVHSDSDSGSSGSGSDMSDRISNDDEEGGCDNSEQLQ